jgi:hypothetical protein
LLDSQGEHNFEEFGKRIKRKRVSREIKNTVEPLQLNIAIAEDENEFIRRPLNSAEWSITE